MDNPTTIRRPVQRELFEVERGTGTYGPAPRLASVPPRGVRIPYNVAFREVLGFVNAELEAAGESWDDLSKQRVVAGILQSMERWGVLCLWERK